MVGAGFRHRSLALRIGRGHGARARAGRPCKKSNSQGVPTLEALAWALAEGDAAAGARTYVALIDGKRREVFAACARRAAGAAVHDARAPEDAGGLRRRPAARLRGYRRRHGFAHRAAFAHRGAGGRTARLPRRLAQRGGRRRRRPPPRDRAAGERPSGSFGRRAHHGAARRRRARRRGRARPPPCRSRLGAGRGALDRTDSAPPFRPQESGAGVPVLPPSARTADEWPVVREMQAVDLPNAHTPSSAARSRGRGRSGCSRRSSPGDSSITLVSEVDGVWWGTRVAHTPTCGIS